MAPRRHNGASARHDLIPYVLTVGAVALAIVLAVYVYKHYFYHPSVDVSQFPIKGIDVSNHNGRIDWNTVATKGDVKFVYIKASEGATHTDSLFRLNAELARKAGLAVGAYHFFRKNREGQQQADNFIQAVGNIQLDLPWVVDIEDWDNDDDVDAKVVSQRLVDMVTRLEEKGHPVMIYTNGNGFKSYYKPHFQGEPLWLCSFKDPAKLKPSTGHIMQQYSHWGKVEGIDGDVDLNIFMGSTHEWEKWLRRYQSASSNH